MFYLRCPDCNGRRYRDEVLDIRREGADGRRCNIAEVLELTVTEARAFFADAPEVAARLSPLADVGLEYLKLGQPVPTLSGGEAQRLKLAGHLADAASSTLNTTHRGKLFLFDEPTTGLHFEDVAKLLRAFRKLLAAGHSLLVIEHNLDVIRAADWVIDLGPEGGERGGEIVCAGTPAQVRANTRSHTGQALVNYEMSLRGAAAPAPAAAQVAGECPQPTHRPSGHAANSIVIHKAREHNLKNIDVAIPRATVSPSSPVSPVRASRRWPSTSLLQRGTTPLSGITERLRPAIVQPAARPDVDAIFGIPPTVAIEQRTSRGGRKSTVATLTEIYHFLRLLYVKLGTQHCPDCDVAIEPQSPASIAARLLRDYRGRQLTLLAPLVVARKGFYTDLAKWAAKKGFRALCVDGELLPTSPWPRARRASRSTPSNCRLPTSRSA